MIDIQIEVVIKRSGEPVRFTIEGTMDVDSELDPADQYNLTYEGIRQVMTTFPTGFAAHTERSNRQFWRTLDRQTEAA